jgi:hypothetical protein
VGFYLKTMLWIFLFETILEGFMKRAEEFLSTIILVTNMLREEK